MYNTNSWISFTSRKVCQVESSVSQCVLIMDVVTTCVEELIVDVPTVSEDVHLLAHVQVKYIFSDNYTQIIVSF